MKTTLISLIAIILLSLVACHKSESTAVSRSTSSEPRYNWKFSLFTVDSIIYRTPEPDSIYKVFDTVYFTIDSLTLQQAIDTGKFVGDSVFGKHYYRVSALRDTIFFREGSVFYSKI